MNKKITTLAILAAALVVANAPARTKLVTLPDRSKTVMSLENPVHTLLYEEREIPLQKGTNFVDFAWNGVSIDPGSVMVEMLSNPGETPDSTKIIATGFPPNEQAMTWQVYAPEARTERIRVSYLLNGISHNTSYEFSVNEKETAGEFRQYLYLRNNSGENLDETIVRIPVMEDLFRSVATGEVRRFLARKVDAAPVAKLFVAKPGYSYFRGDDGEEIALVYELENSASAGLGSSKLPFGKARIHGDDGMGSTIFLGEDYLKETAPKEKAELSIGSVKDVTLKRRLMKDERTNERRNTNRNVVLFDQVRNLRYEIENFKDEPVTLKVVEQMNGDWEIKEISDPAVRTERKSMSELVLYIDLPAAPTDKTQKVEKKVIDLSFLVKNRFPGEV